MGAVWGGQHFPVYRWVLSHRPAAQPWFVGACHGSEQAFVFGNPRWMWWKNQAFTAGEQDLSKRMQGAWVQFADQGHPGWPSFSEGNTTMVFDLPASSAIPDYHG